MTMSFDYEWPWLGLAAALAMLALLFFTRVFRTAGIAARWHDTWWLGAFGLPLYMAHQFEEHGIDIEGASYAFRGALCEFMGQVNVATCQIPLSFITAVNVGSVWGASVLAVLLGRHRPLIALSAYGIPLVNALLHSFGALREQAYNPGLLTAILLFLPASLWALRVGLRAGIGASGVAAIVLGGVLTHAVLMGSLVAFLHGLINAPMLAAIQFLNMAVPLAVAMVAYRMQNQPAATLRNI